MFKPYPDGDKCPTCNRDRNAIIEGIIRCPNTCEEDSERVVAQRTVFYHFLDMLLCIFNFQFKAAIGCLLFIIERATSSGDYNPDTGKFYKKGYLKKKSK